jgi:hypothetical protein
MLQWFVLFYKTGQRKFGHPYPAVVLLQGKNYEMKKSCLMVFLAFIIALFSLGNCSGRTEQDASRLAHVQRSRMEAIHLMLKSKDPIETEKFRIRILELDYEFELLQSKFDKKYADSSEKLRFEEAYLKALTTKIN